VVSHGDAIRVGLAWLAGLGPDRVPWRDLPNGSITSVRVPATGPS
jgi:broad specificity phosphatase PhoE